MIGKTLISSLEPLLRKGNSFEDLAMVCCTPPEQPKESQLYRKRWRNLHGRVSKAQFGVRSRGLGLSILTTYLRYQFLRIEYTHIRASQETNSDKSLPNVFPAVRLPTEWEHFDENRIYLGKKSTQFEYVGYFLLLPVHFPFQIEQPPVAG